VVELFGVLLLGTVTGVLVGLFPYLLFFTVWLGSLLVLPAAMALLGFWTPFSSISRGNWTPMVLIALSGLANGFFWEFWNHGSNVPLLGYFGYLPFGIQCWAWWLVAAHVLDFHPDFDPKGDGLPGERSVPV